MTNRRNSCEGLQVTGYYSGRAQVAGCPTSRLLYTHCNGSYTKNKSIIRINRSFIIYYNIYCDIIISTPHIVTIIVDVTLFLDLCSLIMQKLLN